MSQHLFLQALKGEVVSRPPVWMMRQAGRYLPEYIALREKYDFFTRVETPELAAEITIQPITRLGVDAAILFSDILVVPQALGFEVTLNEGEGPRLPAPIRTAEQALAVRKPDVADRLHYVMEAVTLTRAELHGKVPLIGFAGAPWTLFCYMVEGRGSKDFAKAKAFAYRHPEAAAHVLDVIADTTIDYLNAQIAAGAQAVQVFDSWAGLLGPDDFNVLALPFLEKIAKGVHGAPVILFAKGSWYALERLAYRSGAAALGLDWTVSPEYARQATGGTITLQGNFDPAKLLSSPAEITQAVHRMIDRFGKDRYIVNLGHGITPDVPVENAMAFVDAVKSWTSDN